jgi:ribose 1,5-bisphosphokinase PhnN
MVARLKDKGREELSSFKRRVLRQRSLERISGEDATWLVEHIEEIERFISRMNERPDLERSMF